MTEQPVTASGERPAKTRSAPDLKAQGITLGYGRHPVIRDLSLTLPGGAVTSIVGPNGCGKSTLLRGLGGLLPLQSGSVQIGERDLASLRSTDLARQIAVLPQQPQIPEGITVGELVATGRHPHRGLLQRWSTRDDEAVARAMVATGTAEHSTRLVEQLSGGQRQRVWLAMVLAQQTRVLLLDEPTSFLDVRHQLSLLTLVHTLNRDHGVGVVMVLHDLALAARFSDHLVAMRDGRVVAHGAPEEVVTPGVIRTTFGIEAEVWRNPRDNTPVVVPQRVADR